MLFSRSLALEVVRMALEAMRANKMRSLLTVLGVIIGVATVIGMGAMVQGLDRSMAKQIRTFGSHILLVSPYAMNGPNSGNVPDSLLKRHAFSQEDVDAIKELIPSVKAVAPLAWPDGEPAIKYGREKARATNTLGTSEEYFEASGLAVERGRAFTHAEVQHSSQVVMLGQDVVDATFPHVSSIGKTIHLGGVPFVVVGEIARRGKMFGQSQDNVVMIPYTSLTKFFPTFFRKGEFRLKVKPREEADIEVTKGELTELLRRRRHLHARQPDNFVLESDDALLNLFHQLTAGFFIVMMAISSIALMVGGIGVMNIMLVSVKERTREIGIRKALGARRGDILGQFLLEAATLTGVGGAIGVLLGAFVAFVASKVSPLPAYVAPWSIVAGLGFSVGIGLFFGSYPAWRAAKLDPIEALRYE